MCHPKQEVPTDFLRNQDGQGWRTACREIVLSPHDGVLDSLVLPWGSAQTMSLFLAEVAQRHADEFVFMVMDQAGWHIAGELAVPPHMRLMFLPPYSPELDPAEHLWEAIREDCFANHVFADLEAVEGALTAGLAALEADIPRTRSMTGFKWSTSISLNATWYEAHRNAWQPHPSGASRALVAWGDACCLGCHGCRLRSTPHTCRAGERVCL